MAESRAEAKSQITEMQKKLEQQERTSGPPGAMPMATKQSLLDASDVAKKHPDKHLRWVNVGVPEKAQSRQREGYERVPAAEGGKQVGNLALFACTKERHEQHVEADRQLRSRRLDAHNVEVEKTAESVAKVLRDKHGIRINAERLMISEG